MDIVIPTYGRFRDQQTLTQLLAAGLKPKLVVQHRERAAYERYDADVEIWALPDDIRTIAPTRQWIVDNVGKDDALIMVDDDLVFYQRRDDDRTKLRDIEPSELKRAFESMAEWLEGYAHVGFAAREGANRNTESLITNTRIMRVLGYDRSILRRRNIRFDEIEVMEDFHVALTLLEYGYGNLVLNDFAHNQGGSGSSGGCSHFRTPELHARNAERLRELHPQFVTVVEKTTKGSFGGGTRTDVRIQWKQALGSKLCTRQLTWYIGLPSASR